VHISNPESLRTIANLKHTNPNLKILLSIGGWGSGRFSEMAADDSLRNSFATDCARVVNEFGIDGIDIDWEYPTSAAAKISNSPDDTKNFTLLMRDIRKAIGNDKLLTLASAASAKYVDFVAIGQYIDFVNIMTYDMDEVPKHHSALYRSELTGEMSCEESVAAHINAGVPISKIVLGMPFYGRARGNLGRAANYSKIITLSEYKTMWDDVAKCPYLVDSNGEIVCTYENPQSIEIKCRYIADKGLRGAMYWEYSCDDENGTLRKSVYNGVKFTK
jgi:chitinase